MKGLPNNLGDIESLWKLNISRSGIEALPSSINQLKNLEELSCQECDGLTRLPDLTGLSCLVNLDLGRCGILEIPEGVGFGSLESLEFLNLSGNNFESIPSSIKELPKLRRLSLAYCERLKELPELPCLKELEASNCSSLASTPFISSLEYRSGGDVVDPSLDFTNCENLDGKIIVDHVLEIHMEKQVNVRLLVPKDEASEKMRYLENGSSLSNIRLDNKRIIGFSFCVVFDPHFDDLIDVSIICKANFKDESGYSLDSKFNFSKSWDWNLEYIYLVHQHLVLWYENLDSKERFTEASFQFYCCDNDLVPIVKCGVHPIYEDDDCVGRDKKRRRNDNHNEDEQDEEDQPSLKKKGKRICSLNLNLSLSLQFSA